MGRTRAKVWLAAAIGGLLVVGVPAIEPAAAAPSGDRPTGVAAIRNVNAKLLPDGGVTVTVKVGCAKGWTGGEVSVQVSQNPTFTPYVSGYTVPEVRCNGRWSRVRFDLPVGYGRLHVGQVTMSSQFLVTNNETGDSAGGHDTLVRRLHR